MSDADRQYWHGRLQSAVQEPHPTDRREARRGMIRIFLLFAAGFWLLWSITP